MDVNKKEDNIKKYKKQELCNSKNAERCICPPLRHLFSNNWGGGSFNP